MPSLLRRVPSELAPCSKSSASRLRCRRALADRKPPGLRPALLFPLELFADPADPRRAPRRISPPAQRGSCSCDLTSSEATCSSPTCRSASPTSNSRNCSIPTASCSRAYLARDPAAGAPTGHGLVELAPERVVDAAIEAASPPSDPAAAGSTSAAPTPPWASPSSARTARRRHEPPGPPPAARRGRRRRIRARSLEDRRAHAAPADPEALDLKHSPLASATSQCRARPSRSAGRSSPFASSYARATSNGMQCSKMTQCPYFGQHLRHRRLIRSPANPAPRPLDRFAIPNRSEVNQAVPASPSSHLRRAHQAPPPARHQPLRLQRPQPLQRPRPIPEMRIPAIRRRPELHRVAREHHPLPRQPDDRVSRRMRPPDMDDLHLPLAHPQRHPPMERDVRPGQPRNPLLAAEQPREPPDLAVHVLLPALDDHLPRHIRRDDLRPLIARRTRAPGQRGNASAPRASPACPSPFGSRAITSRAIAGVACASTTSTHSSPITTPELGSPSAV